MGKAKTNSSRKTVKLTAQAVKGPAVAVGGGDPGTVIINPPVVNAGGTVQVFIVYNGNTTPGEQFALSYINGQVLTNPKLISTAKGTPLSDSFVLTTKSTVAADTVVIVNVEGNAPLAGTVVSGSFVVKPVNMVFARRPSDGADTAAAKRKSARGESATAAAAIGGGDPGSVTSGPPVKGGIPIQIHVDFTEETMEGEEFDIVFDDPDFILGDDPPKLTVAKFEEGEILLIDDFDVPTREGSSGILTISVIGTSITKSVKVKVK